MSEENGLAWIDDDRSYPVSISEGRYGRAGQAVAQSRPGGAIMRSWTSPPGTGWSRSVCSERSSILAPASTAIITGVELGGGGGGSAGRRQVELLPALRLPSGAASAHAPAGLKRDDGGEVSPVVSAHPGSERLAVADDLLAIFAERLADLDVSGGMRWPPLADIRLELGELGLDLAGADAFLCPSARWRSSTPAGEAVAARRHGVLVAVS